MSWVTRQKSRRWFVHLVLPLAGALILASVIYNARTGAQLLGLLWLVVGIVVAVVLYKTGRMGNKQGQMTTAAGEPEAAEVQ